MKRRHVLVLVGPSASSGSSSADHARPSLRIEVPPLICRAAPIRVAEFVAAMVRKERGYALRAQVRDAVASVPRKYDGVRQDDAVRVDATLQVTENVLSARHMVGEVT